MNNDELPPKGMPPPYPENEEPTPLLAQSGPSTVVYQPTETAIVMPVVVNRPMGPKPSPITCPSCNHEIVTRVEYKASTKTHLFAILLCILFWPCVCLPYCIPSCRNANHYCPNCSAFIGSYKN